MADVVFVINKRSSQVVATGSRTVNIGADLSHLHDVVITAPNDNDVLAYDAATQTWRNEPQTGGSSEVNTASNIGTGVGVFASKVGADLQFKSLIAGAGVTLTPTATGITIVASGAGGGGAVDSVNDQIGHVVLDAADVGADAAGTAAASVAAHVAAVDPHPQYTTTAEASAAAPVQSVNSQTGAIVLDTDDIAEGALNHYYPSADESKLAGIEPGAQVNVPTDLSFGTITSTTIPLLSSTGADVAFPAATTSQAGLQAAADKAKLDGIAAGATANSPDAVLLARANHTGTQTASTISDFGSATRAQVEAELVAGSNITITPSGAGATRQLTIASTGGGGAVDSVNGQTGTVVLDTDDISEGLTHLYHTEGRVRSTVLTGLSLMAGGAITAADSVLSALGRLQKQISDAITAIGGKQDTLVSGTNLKTVNGSSLLGAGDLAISGSGMANPMTTAGDIIVGSTGGAPNRLGKGAALQVLRVNSAGTALEYADPATGGGALTHLSEAKNTASPNGSIPAVSLSVSVTEASGDLVLTPKGSGALLIQIPNGLSTGGAKRGVNAIDLQRTRIANSQVASGEQSVIISGENCTASGQRSTMINCWYGTASGAGSGIYSGFNNSATGAYSTVMGGYENVADGDRSSISGGSNATTRLVYGAEARASGSFAVTGDAQRERFILRRTTTDATPTVLTTNLAAPASTNQVILPNTGTYDFAIRVVARAGNTDQASFRITGLITRGASAGTTAIVGTPTVTPVAASAGASAWAVSVSANTTLGCLTITVTGAAATSIRWVADVETVEVVG